MTYCLRNISSCSLHHDFSKVLAGSSVVYHSSRSCALYCQFAIPTCSRFYFTPSSHRFFGHPFGLFQAGSHSASAFMLTESCLLIACRFLLLKMCFLQHSSRLPNCFSFFAGITVHRHITVHV